MLFGRYLVYKGKLMKIDFYSKCLLSMMHYENGETYWASDGHISTDWSSLIEAAILKNVDMIQSVMGDNTKKDIRKSLDMLRKAIELVQEKHETSPTFSRPTSLDTPYDVYKSNYSNEDLAATYNFILLNLQEKNYQDKIELTEYDLAFIKKNLTKEVADVASIEALQGLYEKIIVEQPYFWDYQRSEGLWATLFSPKPKKEFQESFVSAFQAKALSLLMQESDQQAAFEKLLPILTQLRIRNPSFEPFMLEHDKKALEKGEGDKDASPTFSE